MTVIIDFLCKYGMLATFLMIFLEYACFPVSSEIILPLAGALAARNNNSFLFTLVLSIIAGLLGTGICYFIGRLGGKLFIERLCKRFPKIKNGISASETKFSNHGKYAVFIGRMIPLCRTYIAFVAGALKLPLLSYIIWSSLGITVWNTLLLGIGYLLLDNWSLASAYYIRYKRAVIPVILVFLLLMIFSKLRHQKTQP